MLKFKLERNKDVMNEGYNNGYIVEVAFFIGTKSYINKEINIKLVNETNIDGEVAFYFYVKYLVKHFEQSKCDDIYEYVEKHYGEDLDMFIKEYFVEV